MTAPDRTPIFDQLTAIRAWTAANIRARNAYYRQPFAATHVAHCTGTCGGWVATNRNTPRPVTCTPCHNAQRNARPDKDQP